MIALDQTTSSHLDFLLAAICRAIQLPVSMYMDAKEKYGAVADWLGRPGSALANLHPEIFPQGSVKIKTTVRPCGRAEYDVDLVLLLHTTTTDAMRLYESVRLRLAARAAYAKILEQKKRCLRLNYAGQFHLDVLPARPDYGQTGTGIWVPDRELQGWSPSDPKGFARWFLSIAAGEELAARNAEPLPEPEGADEKSPLQRTVQLMKRRRDVYFGGDPDAPRSIVLTTLAATKYQNQTNVLATLYDVLDLIWKEIQRTQGVMKVPNPTQPAENFGDAWDERSYEKFVAFVGDFRTEVALLRTPHGVEQVENQLKSMFGEGPTRSAFAKYGHMLREKGERGQLYVGAAGVSTAAFSRASKPPPFRPYGS